MRTPPGERDGGGARPVPAAAESSRPNCVGSGREGSWGEPNGVLEAGRVSEGRSMTRAHAKMFPAMLFTRVKKHNLNFQQKVIS